MCCVGDLGVLRGEFGGIECVVTTGSSRVRWLLVVYAVGKQSFSHNLTRDKKHGLNSDWAEAAPLTRTPARQNHHPHQHNITLSLRFVLTDRGDRFFGSSFTSSANISSLSHVTVCEFLHHLFPSVFQQHMLIGVH